MYARFEHSTFDLLCPLCACLNSVDARQCSHVTCHWTSYSTFMKSPLDSALHTRESPATPWPTLRMGTWEHTVRSSYPFDLDRVAHSILLPSQCGVHAPRAFFSSPQSRLLSNCASVFLTQPDRNAPHPFLLCVIITHTRVVITPPTSSSHRHPFEQHLLLQAWPRSPVHPRSPHFRRIGLSHRSMMDWQLNLGPRRGVGVVPIAPHMGMFATDERPLILHFVRFSFLFFSFSFSFSFRFSFFYSLVLHSLLLIGPLRLLGSGPPLSLVPPPSSTASMQGWAQLYQLDNRNQLAFHLWLQRQRPGPRARRQGQCAASLIALHARGQHRLCHDASQQSLGLLSHHRPLCSMSHQAPRSKSFGAEASFAVHMTAKSH